VTRILIVDDVPSVIKSVRDLLEPNGYEISVAVDARTALGSASPAPDLAIVDKGLPDMDGLQLASRLTQKFPGLRIIVFTGEPTTDSDARSESMQFYDYLPKSNLYDLLLPTIQRALKSNEMPKRDRSTDPIAAAEQYVTEGKFELAALSLANAAREAEFKHDWSRAQELYQNAADHYGRARGIGSDRRGELIKLSENAGRLAKDKV
jgi:DNA-binding NtrC family response regulator